MSVNVLGGSLEFDVVLNTDQLKEGFNDVINTIQQMGDVSTSSLQKTDDTFQKTNTRVTEFNKNLESTSSHVSGLQAITSTLKSMQGVADGVGKAMALLGGDESKAAEFSKTLSSALTILNGVEEASSLLSKDSALNTYLLALQRKAAGVAAVEQAAATGVATTAQAEGIAVTEEATVAQEALNVVMLANPVGAVVAGIGALFAAYEILSNTIFKASDAEKEYQAQIEARKEAEDKAADSTAQEIGHLNVLVETAQNLSLSTDERTKAVEELNAKYPEYLGKLNLESIYSNEASEAIEKQTGLLRQRALVRAAEEVYIENLKEEIKAQNKLNQAQREGQTFWGEVKDALTHSDGKMIELAEDTENLNDATIKANASLKNLIDYQGQLTDALRGSNGAISQQGDELAKLFGNSGFGKLFAERPNPFAGQKKPLYLNPNVSYKPGSPQDLQIQQNIKDDKTITLAELQKKIDSAMPGSLQQLLAQKQKVQNAYDFSIKDNKLFDQTKPGKILDGLSAEDHAKALQVIGDYNKGINEANQGISDFNQQLKEKTSSSIAAAAQSIVLGLQAAGQAGTKAYFDAQKKAIDENAAYEIKQAKDNEGQKARIRAQADADKREVDIKQKNQQIDDAQAILKAQLDFVKQGSQAELKLKEQIIDQDAQKAIIAAGADPETINKLTAEGSQSALEAAQRKLEKLNEINANAAKKKGDLEKQYAIEAAETEARIKIAGIEEQLTAVAEGTQRELDLKKDLIDQKTKLDIEEAQKNIHNEELLVATTNKIHAQALADKGKLDDEYNKKLLDKQLKIIQSRTEAANIPLQATLNNPLATESQKDDAQTGILLNNKKSIQLQLLAIDDQIYRKENDIKALRQQDNILSALTNNKNLLDTDNQIAKKQDDINGLTSQQKDLMNQLLVIIFAIGNNGMTKQQKELKKIAGILGSVSNGFSDISQSLSETNPKLSEMFSKLSQVASFGGHAAAAIASGGADIGADIAVVMDIVGSFTAAAKSAAEAKKKVQDFYDAIAAGEIKTAEASREAARQRAKANENNLKGLRDEYDLLTSQQKQNQEQYNKLLDQIYKESYVSAVKTEKDKFGNPILAAITGPIGILLGAANTTKSVQQMASLAGKSYDELLSLYNNGQLTDKAKALFEQLKGLVDEGQNIQDSLNQLQDTLNQTLTGTTAQNIADSIKSGLADGKRSVADFADDFNSLITNAILSSFEAAQIEPAIEDFYKKFAELSSGAGGALSSEQIRQLQVIYNDDINSFTTQLQQLQQISGINFGNGAGGGGNSLSGAIKGMSEQTAELIAGQFGGLRLTAMDQLDIARQALAVHQRIEGNTASTVNRLETLTSTMVTYFRDTGVKIK